MTNDWPKVKLGEVLHLDLDRVPVEPNTTYPMVGILSFGRGLFDRDPVETGKTSYKVFYRLKPDHVVMSQLFGWEGALALSSPEYSGKFVSPQFPTFLCDESRLDRAFLGWLLRRPALWRDLGSRTSGMGDRRRTLNPDALLACEIPLPPLTDQQRIGRRIDALAADISHTCGLSNQVADGAKAFVTSLHLKLAGSRATKLQNILALEEHTRAVEPAGTYPQVGIKSFGAGLFPKAALEGTQTTYRSFNLLYEGAVVLSQVKGWEGAIAVCPPELAGWFVSPEYRTFKCIASEASPVYLAALVRTQWFWSKLATATRGVGARRERTRPEQFLEIQLPMPTIHQQKQAEPILVQVDALKRVQSDTKAQLDALLPSILDKAFKGEL